MRVIGALVLLLLTHNALGQTNCVKSSVRLNLRQAPGGRILFLVPPGTTLEVLGSAGQGWTACRYQGVRVVASSSFLAPGDCSALAKGPFSGCFRVNRLAILRATPNGALRGTAPAEAILKDLQNAQNFWINVQYEGNSLFILKDNVSPVACPLKAGERHGDVLSPISTPAPVTKPSVTKAPTPKPAANPTPTTKAASTIKPAVTLPPRPSTKHSGALKIKPSPATSFSAMTSCGAAPFVSITLDDGPDPVATEEALKALNAAKVPATFFVSPAGTGSASDAKCALIRRAREMGFDIQSHSWNHADTKTLSDDQLVDSLKKTEDFVYRCLPPGDSHRMTMFRPPYGSITNEQARLVKKTFGYVIAWWNADTNDWTPGRDVTTAWKSLSESMPPASSDRSLVILGHDRHSYKLLPELIVKLKHRYPNRKFVDMVECWNSCTSWVNHIVGGTCAVATDWIRGWN